MKWSQAEPGQTIRVKGEPWKVIAREGDTLTLLHATMGEKVGSPPPDAEVELIPEPPEPKGPAPRPGLSPEELKQYEDAMKAKAPDPDLDRLRRYAIQQGVKPRVAKELGTQELREHIAAIHAERVAEENGVPPRKVEDVRLRLTLGATLVAELHEGSSLPATPQVEVMDRQTMANHLHFFHGVYPAAHVPLEELVTIHQEHHDQDKETDLHEHSVPF